MALTKRGKHFYGEGQADIRAELARYSRANTYAVHFFADEVCGCGATALRLRVDDDEGAAVRSCPDCKLEHPIGDSAKYLAGADLDDCECPCGNDALEITLGLSFYADSEDVRWLYIGCRCPKCKLVAVYADWKYDGIGFRDLLGLPADTVVTEAARGPATAPGVIKGIQFDKSTARSGKLARFVVHHVTAVRQKVTIACSEGFSVRPTSIDVGPAPIEGWAHTSLVVKRRGSTTPSCLLTFTMGGFECRKRLKVTD